MKRTTLQNKSFHKYFELLANALNDAGFDCKEMVRLTEGKIDGSWSPEMVKEKLWRPFMLAKTGKESTTELTTAEVNRVYEELDYRIGQLTSVHVEFPHDETGDSYESE